LALGTVLLILEVFGAGGYLLWTGIAAACIVAALIKFLFPRTGAGPWQLLLFGDVVDSYSGVLVETSEQQCRQWRPAINRG
jgi:membrane protein implicated in regulation of membrane protease activity